MKSKENELFKLMTSSDFVASVADPLETEQNKKTTSEICERE